MNTTSRRFALWLITGLFCIIFYMKSREPQPSVGGTAFSYYTSTGIMIKIDGTIPTSGIFRLKLGATVDSVISMTFPDSLDIIVTESNADKQLQQGDAVNISSKSKQVLGITVSRMSANEMILLGIKLQPDFMSVDDWVALPGIGPALAKTIITDRQENGDFHTIAALQRVPGIGKDKLRRIKPFF